MRNKDLKTMSKPASILDHYPDYEVTIGIEVHTQLNTKSKIFCTCAIEIQKEPNTNICQICAGYPGVLPVLNKQVVNFGILAGLATNCTIAKLCTFDRKHYFYPDLPKNYQITQNFFPICTKGYIPIRLHDGTIKNIRLTRIHIEEDAGKNIHSSFSNESYVDLNRTGTPLLEIVSEPDIASTEEAKLYLKALHSIVRYLNICTGNMDEGAFRADTNVSVRKKGDPKLGTRCELKNINSFKFIGDAVEYEIERHIQILQEGGKIRQETRQWDSKNKKTLAMRSKEEAADYRYFEEPDLPNVEISSEWIETIRKQMPELPHQKFDRFCTEKGISEYEAEILVEDLDLANYFEKAYNAHPSKQIINWVLRDVMGYLKEHKIEITAFNVTPEKLATLVALVDTGKINNTAAKEVFAIVAQTGQEPAAVVQEKGLEQIGSTDELEKIVQQIIAANPENVKLYQSGKQQLFGFFVGQAMKQTQGKANPQILQELFKKHLGA